MKLYISADIEGIAGITNWNEASPEHADYAQFRKLMTEEVVAACEGAKAAGATDIWVKDAHNTGRNLLLEDLPDYVTLIRSWSGSPASMLQDLDESFDAVAMIGWHARAGAEQNPLAHTLSLKVEQIRINGTPVSEFGVFSRLAEHYGVPTVFLSGDAGVCAEVKNYNPAITTVSVGKGRGPSTISLTPQAARKQIREGIEKALRGDLRACCIALPKNFTVEVAYNTPTDAYKFSWYPGAQHSGERTIKFEAPDFFEACRFLQFVT
ncbi:MAG: M55 family metallopeptidase [Alphaproteobacteria bacterium]|nr:M55 family metallopeptidase [Alphaproteobacteria bacterium]